MSLFSLVCIMYSLVCGGAYGTEDLVSSCGPGLGILILLIFPVIWSLPQGLVAAELGSAMPYEGGYYKWVQRAFGEFWGYQVGWWRTVSCYIDTAIYVVLAVGYLGAVFNLTYLQAVIIKAAIVLFYTYINIRGISLMGKFTEALTTFVILFTLLFVIMCAFNWSFNPVVPFSAEGQDVFRSAGLGFIIAIWLYSGFESIGTIAGEMKNPHLIPKAIVLSLPLIVATYVLPTFFGLAKHGNWEEWSSDGAVNFVAIAHEFNMPWFSALAVAAAIACNLSLYNSYVASVSRGFYVLAEDNLAPPLMTGIHKKHGTPAVAILSMCIVNLGLILFDFETLVIIDVVLLSASYLLCYLSAIRLRIKEPDMPRPFKIRGGAGSLVALTAVPIVLCVASMFSNGVEYIIGGCAGILSGALTYVFFKKRYGGTDSSGKLGRENILRVTALSVACVFVIVVTMAVQ